MWMQTYSGKKLDFAFPAEADIDILDIAVGLARTQRFAGQTIHPYSVLRHSLLVASLTPAAFQLEALLHDAAEAYMGDTVSPLKHLIEGAHRPREEKLEQVIFKKFGARYPIAPQVVAADRHAVYLEAKYLMPYPPLEDWHMQFKNPDMRTEQFDLKEQSAPEETLVLAFKELVNRLSSERLCKNLVDSTK